MFINAVLLLCASCTLLISLLCFIFCKVKMPLTGEKKRKYNKSYYSANKDTISDKKKEAYH